MPTRLKSSPSNTPTPTNPPIHPKVIQSIMRHSDINLTMSRYTHIFRGQESEAVAKLPELGATSKKRRNAGS